MPLADFKCTKCSTEKELLVKNTKEFVKCDCGCYMTAQVGTPNFALKGKGWFKDGYTK